MTDSQPFIDLTWGAQSLSFCGKNQRRKEWSNLSKDKQAKGVRLLDVLIIHVV